MSAVHAIERALGIQIDPAVRMLRRLFYCGEWIESHALHVFLLHAPDFLGYADAIQMARDHHAFVEQGLRLKKIGNRIVSSAGRPRDPSHFRGCRRILQGAFPQRVARAGWRISNGRSRLRLPR